MATSGTLGQTQLRTDTLIEHAIRRCRIPPTAQSSETVTIAKENLYLLILSLVGRGLNLWCIDQLILSLNPGQERYLLPSGSLTVTDALLHTPSIVTPISSVGILNGFQSEIEATQIIEVGVRFSSLLDNSVITVSTSGDGVVWTSQATYQVPDNHLDLVWIRLDPALTSAWFQVTTDLASTITEVFLVSSVSPIPLGKWNRNQHAYNQNLQSSGTVTNYFLELGTTPAILVWPRPENDMDHIMVWRHRQIQDVGKLTNELEIPNRWKEAIIWQLALRLAYEMPVGPEVVAQIMPLAERTLAEAEAQENDGSGLDFDFPTAAYTRW